MSNFIIDWTSNIFDCCSTNLFRALLNAKNEDYSGNVAEMIKIVTCHILTCFIEHKLLTVQVSRRLSKLAGVLIYPNTKQHSIRAQLLVQYLNIQNLYIILICWITTMFVRPIFWAVKKFQGQMPSLIKNKSLLKILILFENPVNI